MSLNAHLPFPASQVDGRHGSGATLITGGAGFIGSNLAVRLLRAGQRVIIFDNLSRPGVERNISELQAAFPDLLDVRVEDVRRRSVVASSVADASEVFHFAAQVAVTTALELPQADFDVNLYGTFNVLESIRDLPRPCPLLYTSTNKVYGNLPDVQLEIDGDRYRPADRALSIQGIAEQRTLDFCSPYGCSKGAADQYVLDYTRSFGLQTCVLRMSCIYGPRQCGNEDQGWLCHFVRAALDQVPLTIYGDGRQVRDALFVEDLIDAMLLARERMGAVSGRAFNMGGGPANTISLIELIRIIERLTATRMRTKHADWRSGDQRWYVSDTRSFESATGWRPRVGIDQGVQRLHQWLRSSGLRSYLQAPMPANLRAAV